MIKFDFSTFMSLEGENEYNDKIHDIRKKLESNDKVFDFSDVDKSISPNEIEKIIRVSNYVRKNTDVFLVIGIGGSYLGSKAVIEVFSKYFKKSKVEIIYAGFSLSSTYLNELIDYIKDKEVIVNVI